MSDASEKKKELFKKDIAKAMDLIEKANAALTKAKGRLPKRTPQNVPAGTALYADYGQTTLQDVLTDLHNDDKKNPMGVTQSLLETMGKVQTLVEGEAGFVF